MKVKSSTYLTKAKPLLKVLLEQLLLDYSYVSILAVDSVGKSYSVSRSGINISADKMMSSRGFVVKVYDDKGYAEYSFNEISKEIIPQIIDKIKNHLIPLVNMIPNGLSKSDYSMLPEETITLSESVDYEIDPEVMGDEAIINHMSKIRKIGLEYDEKVLDCSAGTNYQRYSKMFLSKNKDLEQNIIWMTGGINVLCSSGEEIKSYFKGYSNLGGAEVIDKMESDVLDVAKMSLELLDSKQIEPGQYDCICTPEVTGMIVHEAFGHGVEMDMFVKNRALAEEYIGKYVASPLVSMHDGASAAKETATFFFDDEGIIAQDTLVIDKGILKQGISDMQSAMHLGTKPTGNGRRESYERKAYTRMTNTFFEAGNDKLEDMIASISYGFFLENATSGMEDPKNWGIQCMVNVAREIKDGQFTGKIFSPIVLTGYVPDLLKSISMISENVTLGGGGFCGKGHKEWVKVSDGGAYIKAKIRLG